VLARPARSPSPALYVCVCVSSDVMFLCRSMCFFLSGRLSFAMRLLQRSVVLVEGSAGRLVPVNSNSRK
jgi:hypothetical protein